MTNNIIKNPKVSVLMSSYNEEKYIKEAIESILNQTFTDFELIIVDDGSTDSTKNIIKKIQNKDNRVILIENKTNQGIFKSLNIGLKKAKGEYIVKMDADDWSYPGRIKKQVTFMDSNKKVVLSGGTMELCDNELNIINKRKYNLTDNEIRKNIFRYSPFCHPTTIYKTSSAKKIGGYNEKLVAAGDYDFYFRMGTRGEFANLSDVLLKYRVNNGSVSVTKARKQEKITLDTRKRAARVYGYKMTPMDRIYNFLQRVSMFIIPQKIKFWIFNFFR